MKLTIIPSDSAIYINKECLMNLNLSNCNIPNGVHALQWDNGVGEIEYIDINTPNIKIDTLPDWANVCVDVWNNKIKEINQISNSLEIALNEIKTDMP